MKFLKVLLWIMVVLIALFFVIGFFLKGNWEVSENITVKAKAEQIYPFVANLKKWQEWSPWTLDKDPTMSFTYEGPEEGVGARWNWRSEKMGVGWIKIVEADPEHGIKYLLFIDMKGSLSTIHGQIAFEAQGDDTLIRWTDHGDVGDTIIRKWMALAMGVMIARDMSEGLSKLNESLFLKDRE